MESETQDSVIESEAMEEADESLLAESDTGTDSDRHNLTEIVEAEYPRRAEDNKKNKSGEPSSYAIHGKKLLSYKGKVIEGGGVYMPSELIKAHAEESAKSGQEDRHYDTIDGAVVIFYYRDPKTGNVYFPLEVKSGHPNPEVDGKIGFLGGTIKVGESPPEAAVREVQEEDPDSYQILIKALKENGYKFDEARGRVDGVLAITTVYAAEIKDTASIETIKSSQLTEGYKIVLSLEEIVNLLKKDKSAFAYQYGDVLQKFVDSPKFRKITKFQEEIQNLYTKPNSSALLMSKPMQAYKPSGVFVYNAATNYSDIPHNRNPSLITVPASLASLPAQMSSGM